MRQHLFTFAAVVSLLLCVLTIGIWLSGRHFGFSHSTAGSAPVKYGFGFDGWHAFVVDIQDVPNEAQVATALAQYNAARNRSLRRGDVGIGGDASTQKDLGPIYLEDGNVRIIAPMAATYDDAVGPPLGRYKMFAFSVWIPILAFLILPAIAAFKFVRHRRSGRPGLCDRCSYNLTGNTSGICPECGSAVRVEVSNSPATNS